jgi:glutaminyl-peptide cyclotransferase
MDEIADLGEGLNEWQVALHLGTADTHNFAIDEDVLAPRELGIEAGAEFEQRGDAATSDDAPGGRLENAADDLQQRALAAAVGSDQADDFAAFDAEGDIAQSPEVGVQGFAPERIQFANAIERRPVKAIELRNVLDEQQVTSLTAYDETMRRWMSGGIAVSVVATTGLFGLLKAQAPAATPVYGYRVMHIYPHDPEAFTQGLEFRGGVLYEGTGLNGRSSIRKVELETGKVLQQALVGIQYFGEGITVVGSELFELTWQAKRGFVYDLNSFRILRDFEYPGEGWGLTHDNRQIYMSDGSAQIRVWNPSSLQELRRINVHDGNKPIDSLNELEFVKGEIYANVWQTDRIARISPADGHVTGWIDLTGLLTSEEQSRADVLNGIAYDSLGDRLFVTGKLWPKLFEIQLVHKSQAKDH